MDTVAARAQYWNGLDRPKASPQMTREAAVKEPQRCVEPTRTESTDSRAWDYTQVRLPIEIPSHRMLWAALVLSALALIFAAQELRATSEGNTGTPAKAPTIHRYWTTSAASQQAQAVGR